MASDPNVHDVLYRTFGYSSFREHQLSAIQTVMAEKYGERFLAAIAEAGIDFSPSR